MNNKYIFLQHPKRTIFLLLLFIINSSIYGQRMRKINMEDYGMKYSIPNDWEVDGFGGTKWEENN